MDKIKGYKGFDKDLQCRGFQYKERETFEMEGPPKACERGFHFCEYPLDVLGYYPPAGGRYAEVEGEGQASRDGNDSKVAVTKIHVGIELSLKALIQSAIKFTFDRAIWNKEGSSATGDQGAASATGTKGAASATGTKGAASATGDQGAASATGDQGAASATGDQGAAISIGRDGKAKGVKGGFLVLAEWKEVSTFNWSRTSIKSVEIDGEIIKENTYYSLVGGEFVVVD